MIPWALMPALIPPRIRASAMNTSAPRTLQDGLRYFNQRRKEADLRAEQARLDALTLTGAVIIED